MSRTNPSAIEQSVWVAALPERVWRALADPGEFGRWWGGALDGPLSPGRTATMMHGGRPYTFDVVQMDAPVRLSWRWHPGERNAIVDYSAEPKTMVTFLLRPFHQGTLLMISETGFDKGALAEREQAFADNVIGWLHQAAALRTHVEAF